ncbi:hypothetical protein M0R04_12535 [Candidatus Dojkabacteria bacterium]|jgi:hypothetical protein|nr:hypothetical protein [Candidatus Dojkabacteria bacterium]
MTKNNIQITEVDAFKVKPNAKYFLVFKSNKKDTRDLTALNEALKNFFGVNKILAIFADEFTEFKMYEIMEDK